MEIVFGIIPTTNIRWEVRYSSRARTEWVPNVWQPIGFILTYATFLVKPPRCYSQDIHMNVRWVYCVHGGFMIELKYFGINNAQNVLCSHQRLWLVEGLHGRKIDSKYRELVTRKRCGFFVYSFLKAYSARMVPSMEYQFELFIFRGLFFFFSFNLS